jgi:hypothetical protein
MPPTVGSRSRRYHRSSVGAAPVNRGPSLANCSTAFAAAVIADATACEEREDARQRRDEAAARAVMRRPERIALVSSHSV